jgi:hypothetical protein
MPGILAGSGRQAGDGRSDGRSVVAIHPREHQLATGERSRLETDNCGCALPAAAGDVTVST